MTLGPVGTCAHAPIATPAAITSAARRTVTIIRLLACPLDVSADLLPTGPPLSLTPCASGWLDPAPILLVQEVEGERFASLDGGVEVGRDCDQPEADGTLPDRP